MCPAAAFSDDTVAWHGAHTEFARAMTQAERALDYLWSVAPNGATNGELARRLGIRSHQTVYMLTQQLMHQGRIRGSQSGTTWVFHVAEEPGTVLGTGPALTNATTPATRFEALARRILSDRYGVALRPGSLPGVAKVFDFVSPGHRVVGDATYFSIAGGVGCQQRNSRSLLNISGCSRRAVPPPHFSCSAISARCRSGGWRAMVSSPQASRSSF